MQGIPCRCSDASPTRLAIERDRQLVLGPHSIGRHLKPEVLRIQRLQEPATCQSKIDGALGFVSQYPFDFGCIAFHVTLRDAHAVLTGKRLDLNLARMALRDTIRRTAQAIALRDVEPAVS